MNREEEIKRIWWMNKQINRGMEDLSLSSLSLIVTNGWHSSPIMEAPPATSKYPQPPLTPTDLGITTGNPTGLMPQNPGQITPDLQFEKKIGHPPSTHPSAILTPQRLPSRAGRSDAGRAVASTSHWSGHACAGTWTTRATAGEPTDSSSSNQ